MERAASILCSDPVAPLADLDSRYTLWALITRPLPLILVVALLSGLVFALMRLALIDDAYITLTYARNLALHLHWGMYLESMSNTATSPLNVLVLAGLIAILGRPVVAVAIVFVAANVLTVIALQRAGARLGLPGWYAGVAVAVLLANPIILSSIGLETSLGIALVALLFMVVIEERPILSGLLLGLIALTRIDLLVIAGSLLAVARPAFRHWWKTAVTVVTVAAPWFIFSWVVLGSAVPDTLFIKTIQRALGAADVSQGIRFYFDVYPVATLLSFIPAALGLVALLRWTLLRARAVSGARRLDMPAALAVGGLLHYLAYTQLGVPPYHWYYAPSIAALTVFVAAFVGGAFASPASSGSRSSWRVAAIPPLAIALLLLPASAALTMKDRPVRYAPMMTNWASAAQYARIATELPGLVGNGAVSFEYGEIGAIAYFCDCVILDIFSDRGRLADVMAAVQRQLRLRRTWLEGLNFRYRDESVPPHRAEYKLEYVEQVSASALASWPVSSPWKGPGTMQLLRAAEPNRTGDDGPPRPR
jgi:hypothetical protein